MYTPKDKFYLDTHKVLLGYKDLEFIPLQIVYKEFPCRGSRVPNYVYEPLFSRLVISDTYLIGLELNGNLTGLTIKLINGITNRETILQEIKFLGKTIVRGKVNDIKYFAFDIDSILQKKLNFRIVTPKEYYKALRRDPE
jgi:hypothetical protein|nr:MAG TPA: hypothetical protein [Caudoviricetes sp.]